MPNQVQVKQQLLNKTFELSAHFEKAAPITVTEENSTDISEYVDISGYASTVGEDRQGDIIPMSTWADPNALKDYLKNPIVLAYHDHEEPIGKTLSVEARDAGLFVTARIYKAACEEVYAMVLAGVLKTFSIGFRLKDLEWDEVREAFILTKIEMYELSIVSVPANQDALFSIVKQLKDAGHSNDLLQTKRQENIMPQPENTTMTNEQLIAKSVADALKARDAEIAAKAQADAAAAAQAAELTKSVTAIVTSNTEKLVADLQKSLEEKNATIESTIAQYKTEIEAKSAEIQAITKSKMAYGNSNNEGPVTQADRETAVLLAAVLGKKSIEDTKFGKEMKEKAAGFTAANAAVHTPGAHTINNADWETEFSTSFWMDVRRQLVVEPLFRNINMNNAVMRLPIIPEQDYATYIAVDNLKGANSIAAVDSGNRPTELTLTAHKLSAVDRIGNEENEDSVLPILGLIRENLMRRMARSSDRSLLRGVGATAADPIKGLAQCGIASTNTYDLSIGGGDKFTALDLQKARRLLGVYGMRPADVAYIISTDAYYDLLEDADMRKYFDVGPNAATILTGEVARVNGSPIIVSDEFAAKGIGAASGLVVNMRNFVIGNLRDITVRTKEEIEYDSQLIVATRRFGMLEMEAGAVATIKWAA